MELILVKVDEDDGSQKTGYYFKEDLPMPDTCFMLNIFKKVDLPNNISILRCFTIVESPNYSIVGTEGKPYLVEQLRFRNGLLQ